MADKKWLAICDILAPLAERIVTVPVASARTADPAELAAAFRSRQPAAEVRACRTLVAALNACDKASFVVITGSLYLVGEALDCLGRANAGESERGLNEWSGSQKTG